MSTQLSLLRWRSGHPTLEIWREGGNDHKWSIANKKSNTAPTTTTTNVTTLSGPLISPQLPHQHTPQQPKLLPRALHPPCKTNTLSTPHSFKEQPQYQNLPFIYGTIMEMLPIWKSMYMTKTEIQPIQIILTHQREQKQSPSHLILILSLVLQHL